MLHFTRSFILVQMGGSVSREFKDRVVACVQDEAPLQEIFADHNVALIFPLNAKATNDHLVSVSV